MANDGLVDKGEGTARQDNEGVRTLCIAFSTDLY